MNFRVIRYSKMFCTFNKHLKFLWQIGSTIKMEFCFGGAWVLNPRIYACQVGIATTELYPQPKNNTLNMFFYYVQRSISI